jgi:methylase of polypeptide subunit release factors
MVSRVPIQYLTNCVHWRDLVLAVGPGVLIPRPETEQMVDLAEEVGPPSGRYHVLKLKGCLV